MKRTTKGRQEAIRNLAGEASHIGQLAEIAADAGAPGHSGRWPGIEEGRMSARKLAPPLEAVRGIRGWYLAEIRTLVDGIEPQLRSGQYREWRAYDGDRFNGDAPRDRLENLCRAIIRTIANARLVLAVSSGADHLMDVDGATELQLAAEAMALDVLSEARRRGIRAPFEKGVLAWRAWSKSNPRGPKPSPEVALSF